LYEGSLNGSKVCVKKLRMYSVMGPKDVEGAFCQEVVVWKRLVHPNIVPLLGVTIKPFQSISIWMSGGELTEYIRMNPSADRIGLLCGIANGLSYLHSCGVIHGDLKGPSILVDDTGYARLTDFGLSGVVSDLGPAAPITDSHTVRWAAPEILDMERSVDEASDVYSFGMVVVETFTGRVPFYERTPTAVAVDVLSGNRPERPIDPNLTDDLWNMTEKCWNRDPLWRPGISEVILRLRVATENGEPLDVTTLGSFPQREPSFEAPCYQPSLLTAASDKVRRLWRFGKAFVSQPSLGNDPADYTGSEGKSADMRPSASDLPRKSGGWFSGYTRRNSSGEKQDGALTGDHKPS